jgi:hypothetical protein
MVNFLVVVKTFHKPVIGAGNIGNAIVNMQWIALPATVGITDPVP